MKKVVSVKRPKARGNETIVTLKNTGTQEKSPRESSPQKEKTGQRLEVPHKI